jgi:hypothetical protein
MNLADPDGQTSWVQVRPSTSAAQAQFLMALVPVATASWAQRMQIDALDSSDTSAGAVMAPGSLLEERSSQSARAIEIDLQGATLSVTGDGIADFHAYAPSAASGTVNGLAVAANFESGMVTYPYKAPPPDAGVPDAGSLDAGVPDAVVADAGAVDAGLPPGGWSSGSYAGTPDAMNSRRQISWPAAAPPAPRPAGSRCSRRSPSRPAAASAERWRFGRVPARLPDGGLPAEHGCGTV